MKTCSRCKIKKPLDDFYANASKSNGRSGECKVCKKLYNAEHYIKTKDRWSDSRAKTREENRKNNRLVLLNYLSNHPCVDCGMSDIRVLQFDHRPDEIKVTEVTKMVDNKTARMLDEIKKCDVRCANCHIIVTYDRMGGTWHTRLTPIAQ